MGNCIADSSTETIPRYRNSSDIDFCEGLIDNSTIENYTGHMEQITNCTCDQCCNFYESHHVRAICTGNYVCTISFDRLTILLASMVNHCALNENWGTIDKIWFSHPLSVNFNIIDNVGYLIVHKYKHHGLFNKGTSTFDAFEYKNCSIVSYIQWYLEKYQNGYDSIRCLLKLSSDVLFKIGQLGYPNEPLEMASLLNFSYNNDDLWNSIEILIKYFDTYYEYE
jgi:hypothetical protein